MKFRYRWFCYIPFLLRYIRFVLSDSVISKSVISKSVISNSLRPVRPISVSLASLFQHDGLLSQSLEFGNAVWATNEDILKPSYRNVSGSVFYTDVKKLEDADTVNKWVSAKTNGKIKELFGKYSHGAVFCWAYAELWKKIFVCALWGFEKFLPGPGRVPLRKTNILFLSPLHLKKCCKSEMARILNGLWK